MVFMEQNFIRYFLELKNIVKIQTVRNIKILVKKESNVHGKILYLSKMICMKVI